MFPIHIIELASITISIEIVKNRLGVIKRFLVPVIFNSVVLEHNIILRISHLGWRNIKIIVPPSKSIIIIRNVIEARHFHVRFLFRLASSFSPDLSRFVLVGILRIGGWVSLFLCVVVRTLGIISSETLIGLVVTRELLESARVWSGCVSFG